MNSANASAASSRVTVSSGAEGEGRAGPDSAALVGAGGAPPLQAVTPASRPPASASIIRRP